MIYFSGALKFELICLSSIALLGIIGGILWGNAVPFLLGGLLVYTGWHLYHLLRLCYFIGSGKQLDPSFPPGLWSIIYRNSYTLKKRSRKRKRRLSRFLKRFTESAAALPDAAVILGQNDDIEWCNPAAGELLGITWPEAAGENIAHMVRDPIFREYLGDEGELGTLELPSPVDQTKILSVYATSFGKKHQRLMIARDITRSYYVDRMRRDFVANASHELRTPLTVIRGLLEVWSSQAGKSPQQQRSTELMLEQAERMGRTINDMLTLSRLEYDGAPPAETAVDMSGLLNTIVKDAAALAGPKGHVIDLVVEHNRHLYGNVTELRDAFSNLIFNAIRHTPPLTRVKVVWTTEEDGAQLIVEDNGEGIAPRHIPRLTERFYRVDAARSHESGGTGLGLAIVKHVLTRHDAELQISSAPGQGSTFVCVFPEKRLVKDSSKCGVARGDYEKAN